MQYAHHANVSKMTFKCHCQLNLSVMTKCFCFWLKTNRLYCFLKVILKLFHHCQPSVDHFIQLRFATHERSNSTCFLTAIWVQVYSQKQTHSEPALISKLLELPCNIIILQIYNSIGINKTNQTLKGFTFIHVVQQARRGAQKHPLYVILSVTHGFIYSVLHCTIYTSLLLSIQSL